MTHSNAQTLIDQLDVLLEKEREVLLEGRLEAMADIAREKENLIDSLNALVPDPKHNISELQTKVVRNQVLLDGAMQGIRNVATRLAALRKFRRTLETYDASGRKQTIEGEIDHQVEKRA